MFSTSTFTVSHGRNEAPSQSVAADLEHSGQHLQQTGNFNNNNLSAGHDISSSSTVSNNYTNRGNEDNNHVGRMDNRTNIRSFSPKASDKRNSVTVNHGSAREGLTNQNVPLSPQYTGYRTMLREVDVVHTDASTTECSESHITNYYPQDILSMTDKELARLSDEESQHALPTSSPTCTT